MADSIDLDDFVMVDTDYAVAEEDGHVEVGNPSTVVEIGVHSRSTLH